MSLYLLVLIGLGGIALAVVAFFLGKSRKQNDTTKKAVDDAKAVIKQDEIVRNGADVNSMSKRLSDALRRKRDS